MVVLEAARVAAVRARAVLVVLAVPDAVASHQVRPEAAVPAELVLAVLRLAAPP